MRLLRHRRHRSGGPSFALLLSLASVGLAPAAEAHAILMGGQPAVQGSVPAGTVAVALRYNSRIDAKRSRLLLIGPDKSEAVLPIQADGPPDQLLAQVALAPGAYTIRWQVLAVDGHITRGDVPFTVTPARP